MKTKCNRIIHFFMFTFLCCYANAETDLAVESTASIMQIMVARIVPASDTLWGVDDPTSDEDWKTLEDAANAMLDSGAAIKLGGTGPRDKQWVSQRDWKMLSEKMIAAAGQALQAIRNKNLDALFDAGDALYQPCEECHGIFNPAVIDQ